MKELKETESAVPANAIGDGIAVADFSPLMRIKKLFKRWNTTEVDKSNHTGPIEVNGISKDLNTKVRRHPFEVLKRQINATKPGELAKAKPLRSIGR